MKNITLILFLLGFANSFAQGREWHVRPYANNYTNPPGADGTSFEKAWCLKYALLGGLNGTEIQAGDTVWLHGDLKSNYSAQGLPTLAYLGRFQCTLQGSATQPIIVSSYPGEWAVINGNTSTFVSESVYFQTTPCVVINGVASLPPPVGPEIEYELIEDEYVTPPNNEEDTYGNILDVKGKFVIFKDFEVTCLGQINRVKDLCVPTNGFEGLTGIGHAPAITSKCEFRNLIVRNIPGPGIGSWKRSADTEIYGCLIYNNGSILRNDEFCNDPNNSFKITGIEHGIYTQNSTDLIRKINNNFLINNYATGIAIWSATKLPGYVSVGGYLKNYELNDNIFINNGNPGRSHTGLEYNDSKPNLIIDSEDLTNYNVPTNISVNRNVFYINDRSSYVSGVRVRNSTNVSIHNNYFFKGTTMGVFTNNLTPADPENNLPACIGCYNKNLSVRGNFYLGKRIQILTQPAIYFANNWNFNNNTYYSWGSHSFPKMYQDDINFKRSIQEFRLFYQFNTTESDQSSFSYKALQEDGFGKDCLKYWYETEIFPILNKIVQNVDNPNKFYLTMNNPTLDASRSVLFNDYNIPNGKNYVVRDPQNYFIIVASGTYNTNSGITFPLNLTSVESPIGFFDHCVEHSYAEISTFIVEFGCSTIPFDINTILNQTDNSTINYKAQNKITFRSNYIANTLAVIDVRAEKSIVFNSNTHLKSGAKFLAKIEDVCVDIVYNSSINNRNISENGNQEQEATTKNNIEPEESIKIYPNPSSGIFNIESINNKNIKSVVVSRIDNGKIVLEQGYNLENTGIIDIKKENTGLYAVKVVFEDNSSATKTIVKN